MTTADNEIETLSDFERAIAYFTLPGIRRPIPAWVYAVFTVALIASLVAFVWGLRTDGGALEMIAGIALGIVIVAGMAVFFGHAIRIEIQEREALASAHEMPNAESDFDAALDPFAKHVLLARPWRRGRDEIPVRDRKGGLVKTLNVDASRSGWTLLGADGAEEFRIRVHDGGVSFSVDSGTARGADAVVQDEVRATVKRRWTWGLDRVLAEQFAPTRRSYAIENGAIHHDGVIVGRVYYIRRTAYLDIEAEHLNEATLTYFLVMT